MNVVSELRANVLTARAFLTLLVGAVIGALLIVCEISMAALIFSGPLAPILPQGIGMLVFGTFALYLVTTPRVRRVEAMSPRTDKRILADWAPFHGNRSVRPWNRPAGRGVR